MAYGRKAPHGGAFLLGLLALTSLLPALLRAADDCSPPPGAESAQVSLVIDGDTLVLEDGRHIRLIGIDTPELGRDGKSDMPGAREAKRGLQSLIRQSARRIYLQPGLQPRDRYHRWLAHLYDRDGHNLTRTLLQQGLGRQIAIPPNLTNLDCYTSAEAGARSAGLGLWRTAVGDAQALHGDETGFHLLQGRIVRVGRSRSALWLNLAGGLAIRITWQDWAGFALQADDSLKGRRLEFRGWLYISKGEQRVRIRHPSAIRWLSNFRR